MPKGYARVYDKPVRPLTDLRNQVRYRGVAGQLALPFDDVA
jgi:hypothetical protein